MPSKFIWRQVPAETADALEFAQGGTRPLIWAGIFGLGACLFPVWVTSQLLPEARDEIVFSLRMKVYSTAALWCVTYSMWYTQVMIMAIVSLWLIFGRTTVLISLAFDSIGKNYRVRGFQLFGRHYRASDVASVSLRRGRGLWGLLGIRSIDLNNKIGGSRKLLMLPRRFQAEGLKMAGQIADFIGVPLVSEFALKPEDTGTPQMDKPT